MTDGQDTTRYREGQETPTISVSAFIEPKTQIETDLINGSPTLEFKGSAYGGVTLFFHDRETMRRAGRAIAAFLA